LLARSYTQLKAYPESLSALERVLKLEPKNERGCVTIQKSALIIF
jgi:hypothetical protein